MQGNSLQSVRALRQRQDGWDVGGAEITNRTASLYYH